MGIKGLQKRQSAISTNQRKSLRFVSTFFMVAFSGICLLFADNVQISIPEPEVGAARPYVDEGTKLPVNPYRSVIKVNVFEANGKPADAIVKCDMPFPNQENTRDGSVVMLIGFQNPYAKVSIVKDGKESKQVLVPLPPLGDIVEVTYHLQSGESASVPSDSNNTWLMKFFCTAAAWNN